MENNASTLVQREEILNNGEIKIAVNSIQRTLFVERLKVDYTYSSRRYYYFLPFDVDNLYPNKVKSIAQRSGTTMSAIGTFQRFLSGEGFTQMNQVVNRNGQTLWDILRFVCKSYAMNYGYALHFNYNLLGQIVEITPVNFEFVRWNGQLDKLIVNPDWARTRYNKKYEKRYFPFDPANVLAEIDQEGGIDNYTGQLFYWIPNKEDFYTPCYWDSVLDDAQFEAESKLYSLSSVQNDYSLSGIISYPAHIEGTGGAEKVKEELRGDKGAANAGGIRVVGAMPIEGLTNWKWFTPISRNNIDSLHTNQIERAKFNIYAAFNQPPILNGVESGGMFNEASFADAFNYYNAAVETDRKDIERELNKILQQSIWASLGEVQISPKKYTTRDALAPTKVTQGAPTNQQQ